MNGHGQIGVAGPVRANSRHRLLLEWSRRAGLAGRCEAGQSHVCALVS